MGNKVDRDDDDKTSNPVWDLTNAIISTLRSGQFNADEHLARVNYLIDMKDAQGIRDLYERENRLSTILGCACPRSRSAEPPIFYAIRVAEHDGEKGLELLKALVECEAPIEQIYGGQLPIHVASRYSNILMLKFCAKYNNIEEIDSKDATALHIAALYDNVAAAEFLLQRGAKPDPKMKHLTPLIISASRGCNPIVKALLEYGANVEMEDADGRTALSYAVRAGHLSTVKILVDIGGCVIHNRDAFGIELFELAIQHNMNHVAKYLYDKGAAPTTIISGAADFAEIHCSRPVLYGDIPTPRQFAIMARSGAGRRVYLFGGIGIKSEDRLRLNTLDYFRNQNLQATWLSDLYYFEFDSVHDPKPFLQDYMSEYAKKVLPHVGIRRWHTHGSKTRICPTEDQLECEHVGDAPGNSNVISHSEFRGDAQFGYFEIQILSIGEAGTISIGMVDSQYDLELPLGHEKISFALQGNSGRILFNFDIGDAWGPRFKRGDIVGCGVTPKTGEAWFTYNGSFLGVAFSHSQIQYRPWCPAVGLGTPGDKVRANFGASPFEFNFHAPMLKAIQAPIDSRALSAVDQMLGCFLHEFDDGNSLLFVGVEKSSKLPFVRLIDCKTWTIRDPIPEGARENPDFLHPDFKRLEYYFDVEKNLLLVAASIISTDPDSTLLISVRCLDCSTWRWQPDNVLRCEADPSMIAPMNLTGYSSIFGFWQRCMWLWHPLRTDDWRIKCGENSKQDWEQLQSEGAPCRRSAYSVIAAGHEGQLLFIHGGADTQEYFSNTMHFREIVSDAGKKKLNWRMPPRSGISPLPRSCGASICLDGKTVFTFGGLNGRNVIEAPELLHFIKENKSTQLGFARLLETSELSDIEIVVQKEQKIKAHKIILHARSKFFRTILSDDQNRARVELLEYSLEEILPLVQFLYRDTLIGGSVPLELSRRFLDVVVGQLAPEHTERVFQCLFCPEVTESSQFNADLLQHALDCMEFSDVTFEIFQAENSSYIRILAHRAVIGSRSTFFHALFFSGMKESQSDTIQIQDVTVDVFRAVLRWIYGQSIDLDIIEPIILDLLKAASFYDIVELKSALETIVSHSLTLQNVASLFLVAENLQAATMREACKTFIDRNQYQLAVTPEFVSDQQAIMKSLEADGVKFTAFEST